MAAGKQKWTGLWRSGRVGRGARWCGSWLPSHQLQGQGAWGPRWYLGANSFLYTFWPADGGHGFHFVPTESVITLRNDVIWRFSRCSCSLLEYRQPNLQIEVYAVCFCLRIIFVFFQAGACVVVRPSYLHLATSEMWCWSGGREYK